jgi:hypothetical protein
MSTPRVLLPVLAVLLSAPAHADSSFLPARMKAVPDLASWRKNHLLQDVEELPGLTDQQKQAILGKITGNLKAQYTALSSVPKPASCAGAPAVNYVYALRATGQHSACVQFAGNCLATADSPLVALVGAQCEADRQNATAAESYFAVASSPKFAAHPDYDQALLENAMYENFGPHPEMVEALLAREPRWDQATRALWKGVIRRAGSVDTGGLTHAQVDNFLDDQIKQARGDLHDLLLSLKIAIAVNVRHHEFLIDVRVRVKEVGVAGIGVDHHLVDLLHAPLVAFGELVVAHAETPVRVALREAAAGGHLVDLVVVEHLEDHFEAVEAGRVGIRLHALLQRSQLGG